MSPSRVGTFLIVEPDIPVAELLAGMCRRIRTARVATTLTDARSQLASRPRLTGMILEVDLPDGCGTGLLRELRTLYPMLPILVLTAKITPDIINRSHRYRAEFHAKPTRRIALVGFIRRAVAFERIPDQRIAWLIEETVNRFGLSPRETDILAAAVAGTARKELCDQLGMTENSMKSLVKNVLRKLPHQSLDEIAREILRVALDGSNGMTLAEHHQSRDTPQPDGPPSIRPPDDGA